MMGAERLNGTLAHIHSVCNTALDTLRANPEYARVPIVAVIEAMSNDALWISNMLIENDKRRGGQLIVMNEHKTSTGELGFGVIKNEKITALLADRTLAALSMRQIEISPRLVSLTTAHTDRRKSPRDLVLQLSEQLRNYRQDLRTRKYSGKHAGPDDLCIAFMMGPLWMAYFCGSQREDYVAFKDRFPLCFWRSINPASIVAEEISRVDS
jgi:hypothetical protein